MLQTFLNIPSDWLFRSHKLWLYYLENVWYVDFTGRLFDGGDEKEVMLGTPAVATVMILDDDHAGIFHFTGIYKSLYVADASHYKNRIITE